MKRALTFLLAAAGGLVAAGVVMALVVPSGAPTSPGLAIAVGVLCVGAAVGAAALVLGRP